MNSLLLFMSKEEFYPLAKNTRMIDYGFEIETCRAEVYVNKTASACIVFEEKRFAGELKLNSVTDIANFTDGRAYRFLIEYLNSNPNTTVYWSQIDGTTADWVIIRDAFITDIDEISAIVEQSRKNEKYLLINTDGKISTPVLMKDYSSFMSEYTGTMVM